MKNNEVIKEYLKSKSALIVTESSTDRAAWKRLFIELGVSLNSFYSVSEFNEAQEIINSHSPDIIFSSYNIGGESINPLIELHIEKFPDRSNYFCFVVSEKNSLAVAATAAENDIDGLLIKPYNQADLVETVQSSLLNALNLTNEMKLFNDVMANIRKKEFTLAEEGADKFIIKRPESPNGYYLRGLGKKFQGQLEEALGIWNLGLKKNRLHHRTLCALFDAYIENKEFQKAYDIANILTEEFPINPNRIPSFIRASLATKNYQNLIKFCETIIEVNDDLNTIKQPIAAALAICGKNLLLDPHQQNRDLIILASKKSISMSIPQSKIYVTCIENLIELGKFELSRTYIDEIPTSDQNPDVLGLDLIITQALDGPEKSFIKGQNLLKLNIHSPSIYRVILKTGKEIEKTTSQLEDIVFEAAKKYPEMKEEFLNIII